MAIGPFEKSHGPSNSASSPDRPQSGKPASPSQDARTRKILLHPRCAANFDQETEDLIATYHQMKASALDLIDQQIARLTGGEHGLPPYLATLVIAKLAETRIKILALTPATPEGGEALIEFTAEIRALIQQADS